MKEVTPAQSPAKPSTRRKSAASPEAPASVAPRKAAPRRVAKSKAAPTTQPAIAPEERRRMIEVCAYFLAQQRGFVPGNAHQDWLDAEAQIDSLLSQGATMGKSKSNHA